MDSNLFRWINRFADRTGWAHGAFKANAGYGIVLFAVLLLVACSPTDGGGSSPPCSPC